MPYLKVQTNQHLPEAHRAALLADSSRAVAEALGKSEAYVMVVVEDGRAMRFAGTDAPLAFLELKSIGLDEAATPALSARLTALVGDRLGVPPERIYIEFADAPRRFWGWKGDTF